MDCRNLFDMAKTVQPEGLKGSCTHNLARYPSHAPM
jgi:hypothetical protein